MRKHLSGSSLNKLSKASMTADINVTPLVDVVLVLLIIFMVVTPLIQSGIPVNLPVTQTPEKADENERQLLISVKSDGTVYVGSNVVRKEQVESTLRSIKERQPDREIAVKGDRVVNYGEVLNVLKACREVGFQNVALIAQPSKMGAEG